MTVSFRFKVTHREDIPFGSTLITRIQFESEHQHISFMQDTPASVVYVFLPKGTEDQFSIGSFYEMTFNPMTEDSRLA